MSTQDDSNRITKCNHVLYYNAIRGIKTPQKTQKSKKAKSDAKPIKRGATIAKHLANGDKVAELIDAINMNEWLDAIKTLSSWNRFTLGTEVNKAREWIQKQLADMGYKVETKSFAMRGQEGLNIFAKLEGTTDPQDITLIAAHYDSISNKRKETAPGAVDNASGVAAVLQFARIFKKHPPPKGSILFCLWDGEELGMKGSTNFCQNKMIDGTLHDISYANILDTIAWNKSFSKFGENQKLQITCETSESYQLILDDFSRVCAYFLPDEVVVDQCTKPWGSDHMSFIKRGVAAVLLISCDVHKYPHYHKTTDSFDKVIPRVGELVLQLNLALLGYRLGYKTNMT